MAADEQAQWIVPTTGAHTLPVIEILTGRGFITGKSGSGKSNTASVIAEELLENNYNLLVVDPEGEYYGLKESYEILHVGNDDLCDVQVTPEHAEQLAEIALERNMPIILDVSDYLDAEEAKALIANVVRELFRKEKDARKPFLLMIEEMQEYLPQQGGSDELSELLERVAKRGRKRGLGMLGMSQRPSSVDKDFITQCDWMVWHRLTWQNDIDVVRKVLGSEIAGEVEDLDTGEGYLMTDWDEAVDRVQFKRKRTHDAGATPGLESYERPDLKSVSADLVEEIESGGPRAGTDAEGDDTAELPPDAQADLNAAVETVEVEGVPVDDAPSTNGDSPTPDSELEANPDSTDASFDAEGTVVSASDLAVEADDVVATRDPSSLEEPELRAHFDTLQRRNQLLEDEVRELRGILQGVETGSSPTVDPAREAASADVSDDERRQQESALETPTRPAPPELSPPHPPEPPAERTGVAGNLLELVEMTGYLARSLGYRCRLAVYRFRRAVRGRESDGSANLE